MKAGAERVSPWQQPLPDLLVCSGFIFLELKEQSCTLLSRNFPFSSSNGVKKKKSGCEHLLVNLAVVKCVYEIPWNKHELNPNQSV